MQQCILEAMTLALCIVGCGTYARSVLEDIHDMTEDIALFYPESTEGHRWTA